MTIEETAPLPKAPRSKRKLAALIAGVAIAWAALGVGGGYVGASLNPAHKGTQGPQGIPGHDGTNGTDGKNGTNATVGTIGLCVNGTTYGSDFAITDVTQADLNADHSIICQAGSFVSVKPVVVPTPGG